MTYQVARRYLRCDRCKEKAHMTDWQPEPGLDHELCEFACTRCDHRWYQIIPREEQWDYKA